MHIKKVEELDSSFNNFNTYKEVFVCSNRLINTKHILKSSEDWTPLVIRKSLDGKPIVWLSVAIIEDNKIIGYIEIIQENRVVFDQRDLDFKVTELGFIIKIGSTTICEAGDVEENSIEIFKLDLRPLGLNIHGDHNILNIGTNKMSRNTSSNSEAMFGI
ncbi:hypothetical protein [Acinetobacter pittii]|uniref:hypothetical protein n=1 Tax=Acinetobacter pittii TaxID=48296 RepID=UPI001D177A89|nr:hypothetical protein [Acinetobacter pittii]